MRLFLDEIDIWIDTSSRSPFPVQGSILWTFIEGPDEQEEEGGRDLPSHFFSL